MMWFTSLGTEKRLVLLSFAFVFLTFAVLGVVFEQQIVVTQYGVGKTSFDASQPVGYTPLGTSASSGRLKAMVKGSIYETGENMTVFGACFDGDSYLLPEANATFTAWYPNGTIVTGPNATMDMITEGFEGYNLTNGTGRWKIHVTMGSTIGTYLTEMRCEYQGEWAVAYGEWQNPEWVRRIGETQLSVNNTYSLLQNVSNNLDVFINDTSNNFTQVLTAISAVSGNSSLSDAQKIEKLKEIYNAVKNQAGLFWVLDADNPTYSLGSNMNNWVAVDMLSPVDVWVVAGDGVYQYWDGSVWTYGNMSGVTWHGVGMLDSTMPYAWMVGEQGGQGVYSVNGANVTVLGLTTALYDVKLVHDANDPAANVTIYVLADDGTYMSTDFGLSWMKVVNSTTSRGRLSNIIANADLGVTSGHRVAMVDVAGQFSYYDGLSWSTSVTATHSYTDAVLVHDAFGYVVGYDSSDNKNKVWEFSGNVSNLTEVYVWDNSTSAMPRGIAASSRDDVWVVTLDPSVFYHYDGFSWEYTAFPYSQYLTVVINLGVGNVTPSNFTVTGLQDIVMSSGYAGYAVGADGMILKYYSSMSAQFDLLLANLTAQLNALNQTVAAVYNEVVAMNTTIMTQLTNMDLKLDTMNASIQYKLDNILSNVTYGNLYMETTLFPMLNATYQNTILILQQLGILSAQINQTIELQNQTLQIVNQTSQDVSELVNRSRRIRAWVTQ